MRDMTDDDLHAVLRGYDLGELLHARRVESGFVNENWILQTTLGRYLLKRRAPELRDSSIIQAQHALVRHLRQGSFPAPGIAPTRAGDTFLVLDGEFFEIQSYIEHITYDHRRLAHFDAAARTLGRYHRCVETFSCATLMGSHRPYGPAIAASRLGEIIESWHVAGSSRLSVQTRRISVHVDELARHFAGHGELPHVVIHGDFYADNLLFGGDRIVGVVDYDKARWEARVAEVAEALIYFTGPRPAQFNHIVYPGVLQWEPLTRFMRNYLTEINLEERESRALPDYVRAIWLTFSLQRLVEQGRPPPEAAEALDETIALGDWARDNADRMVQIGLRR